MFPTEGLSTIDLTQLLDESIDNSYFEQQQMENPQSEKHQSETPQLNTDNLTMTIPPSLLKHRGIPHSKPSTLSKTAMPDKTPNASSEETLEVRHILTNVKVCPWCGVGLLY